MIRPNAKNELNKTGFLIPANTRKKQRLLVLILINAKRAMTGKKQSELAERWRGSASKHNWSNPHSQSNTQSVEKQATVSCVLYSNQRIKNTWRRKNPPLNWRRFPRKRHEPASRHKLPHTNTPTAGRRETISRLSVKLLLLINELRHTGDGSRYVPLHDMTSHATRKHKLTITDIHRILNAENIAVLSPTGFFENIFLNNFSSLIQLRRGGKLPQAQWKLQASDRNSHTSPPTSELKQRKW